MASSSDCSDSIDSDSATVCKRRKKGVVNRMNYQPFLIKTAKIKGLSHINHVGKSIDTRKTGSSCRCPRGCFNGLTEEDKMTILNYVNNFDTKDAQDTYSQSLIEFKDISRERKHPEASVSKPKIHSFTYYICLNSRRVPVCKQTFISLHGVSSKKTRCLCLLLAANESPKDKEGTSIGSRHNVITEETCMSISQFIESFDLKQVHYSNNTTKKYLPANLNVRAMYDMYVNKFPNMKGTVKYKFFLKYFKENYTLPFGRPQIDVCSFCEEYKQKMRSAHLNDTAKRVATAEYIVHKQRASKYYNKIKEIKAQSLKNDHIAGIVIDYMQNLPLPHIPVQEVFYYRKLWVFVFCIHNLKTNKARFYSYHEGEALKGPNEVCTFLNDYVNEYVAETVTELHIFSDGCPGQNKNNTVVRFLLTLASSGRFKQIYHYFPIKRHSFNECDRNFTVVKRKLRKEDRIYTPEQYISMIVQSSSTNKFSVKRVGTSDIIDFKRWWPTHYKRSVLSTASFGKKIPRKDEISFQISGYNEFKYDFRAPGVLTVSKWISSLPELSETFALSKPTGLRPALPTLLDYQAYNGKLPINIKKVNDIKKLMQYIGDEHIRFYHDIVNNWPTTEQEALQEEAL